MSTRIFKRANFAAIVAATAAVLFATSAMAASFQVLHSFSGPDGETPAAALVQSADGFLYGVAAHRPPPGNAADSGGSQSGSLVMKSHQSSARGEGASP